MLTNSPKIFHITKSDFHRLNCIQNVQNLLHIPKMQINCPYLEENTSRQQPIG